jgi:DNA-binding XRE family transcriptional regulator
MKFKEEWKHIKGLENKYLISNLGRVKSLPRKYVKKSRILKTPLDAYGYPVVYLDKKYKVHRLVASHFLPEIPNKPIVNHINGIKNDNKVSNLEWSTYSENMTHAYKNNLNKGPKGVKNRHSKLSERDVISIKIKYIPRKYTMDRLAKEFNVSRQSIKNIIKNKTWRHIDG